MRKRWPVAHKEILGLNTVISNVNMHYVRSVYKTQTFWLELVSVFKHALNINLYLNKLINNKQKLKKI